jgi:hypothetical protein
VGTHATASTARRSAHASRPLRLPAAPTLHPTATTPFPGGSRPRGDGFPDPPSPRPTSSASSDAALTTGTAGRGAVTRQGSRRLSPQGLTATSAWSEGSSAFLASAGPRAARTQVADLGGAEHPRTREDGREISGCDECDRLGAEEMRPAKAEDAAPRSVSTAAGGLRDGAERAQADLGAAPPPAAPSLAPIPRTAATAPSATRPSLATPSPTFASRPSPAHRSLPLAGQVRGDAFQGFTTTTHPTAIRPRTFEPAAEPGTACAPQPPAGTAATSHRKGVI